MKRKARAVWTFEELPPASKSGCTFDKCRRYADYKGTYGRPDGLFKFTVKVCAIHKLQLGMQK